MTEHKNLIEHHTKYLELDGVDETVWITREKHKAIHKEWHVPRRITNAAHQRTKKAKEARKQRIQRIDFFDVVGTNTILREQIGYYATTGSVWVSSFFEGNHGHRLVKVGEHGA